MDIALQALFSWQFILFCLSIVAGTFIVRKMVEFWLDKPYIPASKLSNFWTELVLPIMPLFMGAITAYFASDYPYPAVLTGVSGRIAFGLVAGLLSGLVYRVIKGTVLNKLAPESDVTQSPLDPDLMNRVKDSIKKED